MKGIVYRFLSIALVLLSAPSLFSIEREPIANYQVLFSPEDHVADQLISLIEKEKKSIKAAIYCLMHRGISNALIDAHKRGVDVEVIVDPFSVKSRSPVNKMGAAQLPVFVWDPPTLETKKGRKTHKRKPLMHDKFCVLGDAKVWTGSFNFTFEAANANKENVIVLESSEVARRYLEEFKRLKKQGCVPLSDYLKEKEKNL